MPATDENLSIEDLTLPKTIVSRLSRGVLPPQTQIQKDALLAMCKSATVFVNYLTSTANEYAMRGNKKTIQPRDVLDAASDMEFKGFIPRLEAELSKYNSIQYEKRQTYKQRAANKAHANLEPTDTAARARAANTQEQGDESPPAKRARCSGGADAEQTSASGGDDDNDDATEDVLEEDLHEEDDDSEEVEEEDVEGEAEDDQLVEDPMEEHEKGASEDEAVEEDASE